MTEHDRSFLSHQTQRVRDSCTEGWRVLRAKGPGKVTFWFIALAIGIAAGFAALFFRKGINLLQETLYGTDNVQYLHSFVTGLDWYWIVVIPTVGGLVVGADPASLHAGRARAFGRGCDRRLRAA